MRRNLQWNAQSVHVHSRFSPPLPFFLLFFYRQRNLRFLVMKKKNAKKRNINKWKKFRCLTRGLQMLLKRQFVVAPKCIFNRFFSLSSLFRSSIFITTKTEANVHMQQTQQQLNRDSVCWPAVCAVDARTTTNVSMHVAHIRLATYSVSRGYIVIVYKQMHARCSSPNLINNLLSYANW